MNDPQFEFGLIYGPMFIPGTKNHVDIGISCYIPGAGPGMDNMATVKMRRLWATLCSIVTKNPWYISPNTVMTFGKYGNRVRLDCSYYRENLGPKMAPSSLYGTFEWKGEFLKPEKVKEIGDIMSNEVKRFIGTLHLKPDPVAHVGWPATGLDRSHGYLPYLLDMGPCPDW